MAPVVTISAPSSRDKGQSFVITGILYESATGQPIVGVNVFLYRNDTFLGAVATGLDGDYLKSVSIDTAGTWTLRVRYGTATDTTTITIIETEPEPVRHDVGFGIFDGEINQYVPCTIIVDGTRHNVTTYKVFSLEEGVHTFNLELPDNYNWAKWTVYSWVTGKIVGEPTGRPLSLNIVENTFVYGVITPAPEPVVSAYIPEIVYLIAGMPAWGIIWSDPTGPVPVSPPNYPDRPAQVGEKIYLGVGWHNIGDVAIRGHVGLKVTAPSGRIYNPTAYLNQDITKNPRHGAAVLFNAVTLNEGGSWRIKATVSHAGVILDTETISFGVIEAPVGIRTTLTLDAPSSVGINERFNVSGILYETDFGIPIPSHPINHSYNGRNLGSSMTDIDGQYLKEVSVPESGVWTLKSEFPGTEGLQASRALVDAVVAATPLATALQIAGPIATAIALVIYGTR